jgi:hypothetical protein
LGSEAAIGQRATRVGSAAEAASSSDRNRKSRVEGKIGAVSIIRTPIVAIAFVVEKLRQLPGVRAFGRHRVAIVTALLVLAAIAFIVWGLERAPQRLTLAQLANGELSPMQSWIIVSGELRNESSQPPRYLYRLTDPQAPNASMIVEATFELAPGWQTISGQYTGTRFGVPPGFNWVGYMEAEPIMAQEQPPPWIAMGLFGFALLIVVASRTTYPTFFRESPGRNERAASTLPVRVHESWPAPGEAVSGTLLFPPDGPVQLRSRDGEAVELRLHSPHTSADVGELRSLNSSEPALLLRRSTGELMLGFASRADRDASFTAVVADARRGVAAVGR